jgi:hypothetical protein
MKTFFFCLLLSSSFALAEVVILHEDKEDLNKDGKKDSIAWVASSKDAQRPSRLVIRTTGKTLLDLKGNFCKPMEKAEDCTDLSVVKRLSPRKEPLLVFTSGPSTWTYRWQKGNYTLYRASWSGEGEKHEINYETGRALVTSSKATHPCPLKNTRAQEDLSSFNLFPIKDEAACP